MCVGLACMLFSACQVLGQHSRALALESRKDLWTEEFHGMQAQEEAAGLLRSRCRTMRDNLEGRDLLQAGAAAGST